MPAKANISYSHDVLVEVLTYHQHTATSSCICGWAELGRSHPEHVAHIYELTMIARQGMDNV